MTWVKSACYNTDKVQVNSFFGQPSVASRLTVQYFLSTGPGWHGRCQIMLTGMVTSRLDSIFGDMCIFALAGKSESGFW